MLEDKYVVTVCYTDEDISTTRPNIVCEFCGLQYFSSQGLKSHFMKTHFKRSLSAINFKHLFIEMAQHLNYPEWIYLPDRIETEIRYLFENYEKGYLIYKLSMFLQTPWDNHFTLLKNDQKFGDKDLKFILTKVFPKAMEQINLQDEMLPLPKNVDTASGTDLTRTQKETVLYMGGAILRKLYYKAKSEEERKFIKSLSDESLPPSYQMRDRGGLWGCSTKVGELFEDAQRCFNNHVTSTSRTISLPEIVDKVDLKGFVDLVGGSYAEHTKIYVAQKLTSSYLTAISFAYAKKRSQEHLESKKDSTKKSLRGSLKQPHD